MVGFGADRVVTPEVRDVANQFEDLVDRRDVAGLGFIAIAGSIGVSVANEVVDLVLPHLGFNPDPQRAQDFAAAGLVQILFASAVIGLAGTMLAGSPILFASAIALSIGSVVIGGANLFEWGQRMFASVTGSQPSIRSTGSSTSQSSASSLEQHAATDGGQDSRQSTPPAGGSAPTAATA